MTEKTGHFLDEKQKQAKYDVMTNLMNAYFDTIKENEHLFKNPQHLSDLATSVLVMFTRDVLTHYIQTFNLEANRKEVIKAFCETVKDQVNDNIKRSMV